MAYTVMAYIVMAYIVMAYTSIVMAYTVMACMATATHTVDAHVHRHVLTRAYAHAPYTRLGRRSGWTQQ